MRSLLEVAGVGFAMITGGRLPDMSSGRLNIGVRVEQRSWSLLADD